MEENKAKRSIRLTTSISALKSTSMIPFDETGGLAETDAQSPFYLDLKGQNDVEETTTVTGSTSAGLPRIDKQTYRIGPLQG